MVDGYSIYSHLSTCSILQPVWYFVHDYATATTPTPLHPQFIQIHLHLLMISAKNCWQCMRQSWGGGGGLIWIKPDRRVDTALKVSRSFMSWWQGVWVHVCVVGGQHGVAKEAYLKAGVYLKRSGPQSSSYFKYAPSHLYSFLLTQEAGYEVGSRCCGTACGARAAPNTKRGAEWGSQRVLVNKGRWFPKTPSVALWLLKK